MIVMMIVMNLNKHRTNLSNRKVNQTTNLIVDVDVFDVNDWKMNVNYQTMNLKRKNVNWMMMMNVDDDDDVFDDYYVFVVLMMIEMMIENVDHCSDLFPH